MIYIKSIHVPVHFWRPVKGLSPGMAATLIATDAPRFKKKKKKKDLNEPKNE
jgi:hypothetical protein